MLVGDRGVESAAHREIVHPSLVPRRVDGVGDDDDLAAVADHLTAQGGQGADVVDPPVVAVAEDDGGRGHGDEGAVADRGGDHRLGALASVGTDLEDEGEVGGRAHVGQPEVAQVLLRAVTPRGRSRGPSAAPPGRPSG